jgi:glycosyltransferase involved in cell wall biosynthesis
MAMSYGKAVLVSDIPGMLEVVHDQETGFVFRSGDVDDLVRGICAIFANRPVLEKVAKLGLRLMGEKYNWTVIGQRTKEIYASLEN